MSAKAVVPRDTGALMNSIDATPLVEAGDGLQSIVHAGADNPRTGQNYAQSVHQGRRALFPVNKPYMQFYWKRFGHVVRTGFVASRRGRPFLIDGMEFANLALRAGRFRIRIERKPRDLGS